MLALSTASKFLKFSIVGAVATAIQYTVLIGLTEAFHASPVLGSTVGFALSTFANYWLNKSFTFNSTAPHKFALPRFLLIAACGLMINGVLMFLFYSFAQMHYLFAQLLSTGITLVWNFSANHFWTYRVLPE